MKGLTTSKKARNVKEHRRIPFHLGDPLGRDYFQWLEKASQAGEDDWNDWFEVENKWRDNIVPSNND